MAWTDAPSMRRGGPAQRSGLRRTAGLWAGGIAVAVGVIGCGSDSSTSGAADSGAQAGNAVTIKGFAFAPAGLSVKSGTAVTFTNQDSATHTVTADDGSFDSKNLDQGKTFMFTFSKAGAVKYHCTIHSSMTGTVTVG